MRFLFLFLILFGDAQPGGPIMNLFVGNPGMGKSTICTSLTGYNFPSGRSMVGLTEFFTYKEVPEGSLKGQFVADSPGLQNVAARESAAAEIRKALILNMRYKIFFVCGLHSARILPSDLATIKAVMEALPEGTPYYVIFNQLIPQDVEDVNNGKYAQFFGSNPYTAAYALPRMNEIEGLANQKIPQHYLGLLTTFMNSCPASQMIPEASVKTIMTEEAVWNERMNKYEEKVAELLEQNEADRIAANLKALEDQKLLLEKAAAAEKAAIAEERRLADERLEKRLAEERKLSDEKLAAERKLSDEKLAADRKAAAELAEKLAKERQAEIQKSKQPPTLGDLVDALVGQIPVLGQVPILLPTFPGIGR